MVFTQGSGYAVIASHIGTLVTAKLHGCHMLLLTRCVSHCSTLTVGVSLFLITNNTVSESDDEDVERRMLE